MTLTNSDYNDGGEEDENGDYDDDTDDTAHFHDNPEVLSPPEAHRVV